MKVAIRTICNSCDQLFEAVDQAAPKRTTAMLADLAALTKLRKTLADTWSGMALRNILHDMLRVITRLATYDFNTASASGIKPPSPLKAASDQAKGAACVGLINDLKKRIAAELGRHAALNSKYKDVLCIGYRVKVSGTGYSGAVDDASDMLARANDLKLAIRAAYGLVGTINAAYNADGSILKVFMAPEFFFRGRNGAYDHAIVHGVEAAPDRGIARSEGIMEIMAAECDQVIYNDWLFVLGTAIAATKITETKCLNCTARVRFERVPGSNKTVPKCTANAGHTVSEVPSGAQVENVALIRKQKEPHIVTKELVSHLDFQDDKLPGNVNKLYMDDGTTREHLSVIRAAETSGYTAATSQRTKFQDERMGGCIFKIDGVTIGLEVCLDHAARRDSGSAGRLEHAGDIQLQLIPSAGMQIAALRTVKGGVVFNVDGDTPHIQVVAGTTHAHEHTLTGDWSHTGLTYDQRKSAGMDNDNINALGKGAWVASLAAPALAAGGRGAVVAYGPYPLPTI